MTREQAWPGECKYLDGRALAEVIQGSVSARVAQLKIDGVSPAIAFILMGDDPVDRMQVALKVTAAEASGFRAVLHELPGMAAQTTLNKLLDELSDDDSVHAVFAQLPFPRHISREDAGLHLSSEKDIDLLSPTELGKYYLGRSAFRPVVVEAVVELLNEHEVPIKGADVCILGLGDIISRPLSIAFTDMQATVTVCHLLSQQLEKKTASAEILITSIGTPRFVKWGMVGDGAVVIDLGQTLAGGRAVGDVDEKAVPKRAQGLTPVPGGMGPVVVAQILRNSLSAVEKAIRNAK